MADMNKTCSWDCGDCEAVCSLRCLDSEALEELEALLAEDYLSALPMED